MMEVIPMGFVLFILFCIIMCPIVLSRTKKKSRKESNVIFTEYISENGLTVSKCIDIPTYDGSSKFIVEFFAIVFYLVFL